MTKQMKQIFLMLCVFALLASCMDVSSPQDHPLPANSQETSTQVSSRQPTLITTQISSQPTITFESTMAAYFTTPYPTMEEEPLLSLIQLLQSESCALPCYLGITPGQTTEHEVEKILESLDTSVLSGVRDDGSVFYNTNLDIGDKSLIGLTPDPNMGAANVKIVQSLNLIVKDGVVQKIRTSISTRKFAARFQEYWSRYSMREIFQRHGIPDKIYVSTIFYTNNGIGVEFIIVYERNGIVVYLHEEIQNKQICPKSEKISTDLSLLLTDTSSGLSIFEPELTPSAHPDIYASLEEQLKISRKEFYTQLLSNPSACFEIKKQ